MINKFNSGGFNALDFHTLHSSFKIKSIKRYLLNPKSLWTFISHYVFEALGGRSKCFAGIWHTSTTLPHIHSTFGIVKIFVWHLSKNGWKAASCLSVSCVWSFMGFLNNPREFSIVTEAVPHDSRFLVSSAPRTAPPDVLPQLFIANSDPFLSVKINNKYMKELIQRNLTSKPASVFVWMGFIWLQYWSSPP